MCNVNPREYPLDATTPDVEKLDATPLKGNLLEAIREAEEQMTGTVRVYLQLSGTTEIISNSE